jgi:hypothetical protein
MVLATAWSFDKTVALTIHMVDTSRRRRICFRHVSDHVIVFVSDAKNVYDMTESIASAVFWRDGRPFWTKKKQHGIGFAARAAIYHVVCAANAHS